MSATITLRSRLECAIRYMNENIVNNNLYAYSGRSYPWDDENSPDLSTSSQEDVNSTKRAILYCKKIEIDDVINAIRRFNWTSDTVYTPVDSDSDYTDYRNWVHPESPFYIMNSEGNVYKCIANNYGAPSTNEPTGQATGLTSMPDGYIWKFMFDLTTTISDKFLTDSWIPVPMGASMSASQLNVEANVIAGSIPYIRVDNGGTGYTSTPTVVIVGDGSGATASAQISGGKVTQIIITNEGTGYTYAEIKIFGVGADASAKAMISSESGHGSFAVEELGAFFVEFSVEFQGDSEGYPAESTYRNVGLIENPLNIVSLPISDPHFSTINTIDIENATGEFSQNEIVKGETSEAFGRLYVDETGISTNIYLYDVQGTFIEGELIHGQESSINAIFHDAGTLYTDYAVGSGTLVYKENIQFITRNEIQIEKFVFTIEF